MAKDLGLFLLETTPFFKLFGSKIERFALIFIAFQELERHFDVEILNDWHTCKADRLWKHRANHRSPESLAPDVFCVLMAPRRA